MKRDRASLAFLLGVGVVLLGGASAGSLAQERKTSAPQAMPQDEEGLLKYARQRMNRRQWRDADRAFKTCLEKYPSGAQAETVHTQLGYLHQWYSRRYAEAREWYGRFCEKYPKSQNFWNIRFEIARTFERQSLKAKAIEAYMAIGKEGPDARTRARGIQRAWRLKGKYFTMRVNQSFTAGQQPVVHVNLQNIDKVTYRATHIKYGSLLEHLGGDDSQNFMQSLSKVGKEGRKVIKEWEATYTYPKKNRWRQEQVKVPSTESGVYIVEGEHEGVTMTVTLLVSKYGLVTKSAAGTLLCFAQDRATSQPVEGMRIKVLNKTHPLEGTTDENGIFTGKGYQGGIVVGIKDREIVSSRTHYYGRDRDRPLVYVVTDRPIYRPNQEVNFRIVLRIESGDALQVRPGERVIVEIKDPKGNKMYEKPHRLNEFGSTVGSIVLGDEPALGEYMITARPEKPGPNYNQWQWRWGYGTGTTNFGKFRVDEYRKPEYEVNVAFDKSPVLQGEQISGAIEAKYYFGSPVVDAQVTYVVYRRGHWWTWRNWDFYYEWYADEADQLMWRGKRAHWYGHGQQVFRGSGKTDKDGKIAVSFKAEKWEYDAVYTVVAQVTDLSRRRVDGAGQCKATRAEFGLAMTTNRYVYKPGDRINVKVRATTAEGKRVPNARITLRGHDRRWRDRTWDDQQIYEGEATTDEHGVAEFNLSPDREGGYIYLVAEAKDRKGNEVTTHRYAWLCGNAWSGTHVNLNGIDLILDKRTYERGDTATILVTSQFKNVTLLFTAEGKEIYHHEVVRMKGHVKRIEFKVDRDAYAPNVYVGVAAIKENQIVQKRRMLIVNPSRKFLTVEIKPDKAQYRPREKARYEVRTLDADGKPVSAEVAFGIVDESIYALQPEYAADIRRHFIHRKGNEVRTYSSLYYYDYGRAENKKLGQQRQRGAADAAAPMAEAAKPAAAPAPLRKGKKVGGSSYAKTEIRSNFADTMLWRIVTTDGSGRAVIEIDIPDNLTTWRATARALTRDSRFGQELNSVIARKEMIVRLQTPRFFTQNDETVISAVAHNYLAGEKSVKIELQVEGLEVEGALERIVKIAPKGQTRIDWKARVRRAGSAIVTVKALSDEDSDAMRLVIPVLPHGTMKWDSRGGLVEGRVVEKIVIPEGSVENASELVVVVSPTHAAMVLDALDYLAGYPYGCVEQTMSRFLPTVVVSKALQRLGLERPELQAELPHMVAAGLQRLTNFQQRDGGWGWWKHDKSNPWITAYVVFGLAMAREADHKVDPNVLNRGITELRRHLAASEDSNQQAYLLYALSVAGQRDDTTRARLTDKMGELNVYSKAMLAMVLHRDGRPAGDVLKSLAGDAKVVGGSVHFQGGKDGGWLDHRMEVTGVALRAFLKIDPKHRLIPGMVHWLSMHRQGNYWGSTKQTAMIVFALTEYLAQSGDLDPDMTLSLSLNGKKVFSERITRENWISFDGMRKFDASRLKPGANEIVIEKEGNGSPVYSVYVKYYTEAEDMAPSRGGIQVERSYSRISYENGKRVLQRLESGAEVESGDEIEVRMTVTADRNHEWLMLEDPMPSGFEAVREYWGGRWGRWSYWYSRKEFRDEKVSIAMSTLRRGTHTVSYVMRAEAPGDFHVLPTTVFNMYHPQIGGNSAEFRIRVADQ